MTNFARSERLALAALLREVGPDAPTLCDGWSTRDLAVHIVIRDRYPSAMAGEASEVTAKIPFLNKRAEQRRRELGELDWKQLVGMVAEGPGMLSPVGWGPGEILANTVEFYVHVEDVRRARRGWTRRNILPELEQQLWSALPTMVRLPPWRPETAVKFIALGIGEFSFGKTDVKSKVVSGKPSEIVLYALGRQEQAQVEVRSEKI